MSDEDGDALWVVYRMTVHGKPSGAHAICAQAEWDAIESAQPGYHTLVRAGIASEGEAERLAREASGANASTARLKPR
jgi:hypothetical protein